MYDWIDDGTLVIRNAPIGFGFHGVVETGAGQLPLSLGKWGIPSAPDWPFDEDWLDDQPDEPNTYTMLVLVAYPKGGKVLADDNPTNSPWGEVKKEAAK